MPVNTLEQAITESERHFIIASEAFEEQIKENIAQLLDADTAIVIGLTEVYSMLKPAH